MPKYQIIFVNSNKLKRQKDKKILYDFLILIKSQFAIRHCKKSQPIKLEDLQNIVFFSKLSKLH